MSSRRWERDVEGDWWAYDELLDVLGDVRDAPGPIRRIRDALARIDEARLDPSRGVRYFLESDEFADDAFGDLDKYAEFDIQNIWLVMAATMVNPHFVAEIASAPAVVLGHPEWIDIAIAVDESELGQIVNAPMLLAVLEIEESYSKSQRVEVSAALGVLIELWTALGVLDDAGRLTVLGRWGVPQAILAAWETGKYALREDERDDVAAARRILADAAADVVHPSTQPPL